MPEAKIARLNEKIATLRQEIQRLNALNAQMMQTEDKQISLTDPDVLDGHERLAAELSVTMSKRLSVQRAISLSVTK